MPRVFKEHLTRSFIKALSFRIIAILSNTTIIFFVSGEVKLVFEIILVSTVINTVLYVVHERIWDGIKWGRSHTK